MKNTEENNNPEFEMHENLSKRNVFMKKFRNLLLIALATYVGKQAFDSHKENRDENKAVIKTSNNYLDIAKKIAEVLERGKTMELYDTKTDTLYDKNPDYFKEFTNGQTKLIEKEYYVNNKKVTILSDIGLDFYIVKKGDSIYRIIQNIKAIPKYEYLKKRKSMFNNVKSKILKPGMRLPIPINAEMRELSDRDALRYAMNAINLLKKNEQYGKVVEYYMEVVENPIAQLSKFVLALMYNEAGGKPLGSLLLNRFEPNHYKYAQKDGLNAFSFSYLHILNSGAGLKARRLLNMTIGQSYHPINAVKLMIGFMYEKLSGNESEKKEKIAGMMVGKEEYLKQYNKTENLNSIVDRRKKRIDEAMNIEDCEEFSEQLYEENLEEFARIYNGANWKKANINYVQKLKYHLDKAENVFLISEGKTPMDLGKRIYYFYLSSKVRRNRITRELRNINFMKDEGVFLTDNQVKIAAKILEKRIVNKFGSSKVYRTDKIALNHDTDGVIIRFKRGNREPLIVRISDDDYKYAKNLKK